MANKYRFKKEYEDAIIQLPTIKYPITKNNLTDLIAAKMLKVPSLAHNIEAVNPAEQKILEDKFAGTEVDEFGNRILDSKLRDAAPVGDAEAAALAGAKDGETVAIKNNREDIFVDESQPATTTQIVREPVEEQQVDPEHPVKKEVEPVSPKSTATKGNTKK